MKSLDRLAKRRMLIILAVTVSFMLLAVSILVPAYVGRATIRKKIIPGLVYQWYGGSMQKTLDEQTASANKVLAPTGIVLDNKTPLTCIRNFARGFSTSVSCYGEANGQTDTTNFTAAELTDKLQTISNQLNADGWTGKIERPRSSMYPFMVSYFSKDKINGLNCMVNILEELPHGLGGRVTCSRSFDVLGHP